MVDVVRFGLSYVAQHPECFPLVEAVVSEARRRNFRTAGGALAYTTRKLRQAGLTVATPCGISGASPHASPHPQSPFSEARSSDCARACPAMLRSEQRT